jgi:tRNA A37 threonylcarbamoyladenosine modification protein TsaB
MEVFGAIYDASFNPILQEQALVLDQTKWHDLINQPTVCIGNGHLKTKEFSSPFDVTNIDGTYTSQTLLEMAMARWEAGQFEDLAYIGPNYLKEVYILPK